MTSKNNHFRATSYDVVSIDWTINPLEARKILDVKKNAHTKESDTDNTMKRLPRVLQVNTGVFMF